MIDDSMQSDGKPNNVTSVITRAVGRINYAWKSEAPLLQSLVLTVEKSCLIKQVRITLKVLFDGYPKGYYPMLEKDEIIADFDVELCVNDTKVILYAHKEFAKMSKEDRYRACYLHACLKRVNRDVMTNASLRERFRIESKNISMVSRLLNETCALGLIKISPDSTSDKNRKYLPFWA